MFKKIDWMKDNKKFWVLMTFFAYFAAVASRYLWVYLFGGDTQNMIDNHYMLSTNDGYFFLEGVKNYLNNGLEYVNTRVPSAERYGLVGVTAFVAKLFQIDPETVAFYLPAFISSLIVFPVAAIGRLYNFKWLGMAAAILSGVAWSYYNRTLLGYYDTDMFSVLVPFTAAYFFLKSLKNKSLKNILIGSFILALYPYLYDQGLVISSLIFIFFIAASVLIYRKTDRVFIYETVVLAGLPILFFKEHSIPGLIHNSTITPFFLTLFFGSVIYYVFTKKKALGMDKALQKYLLIYTVIFVGAVFYSAGFAEILIDKVRYYLSSGADMKSSLKFFQVNKTIQEASPISWERLSLRVSGSVFAFIVSLIGMVFLFIRKREFLVFAPFAMIGFFSLYGGLRFTIYLVPVAAIGFAYALKLMIDSNFVSKKITSGIAAILFLWVITSNIMHIMSYQTRAVFVKDQVSLLKKFDKDVKGDSVMISWWDYGYPIWYYANSSTLIDGGKHAQDNYLVSKIFSTDSQKLAANLAKKVSTIYPNKKNKLATKILFEGKDPENVLKKIESEKTKTNKGVFLMIPYQMQMIFPTMYQFSNLDLKTGAKKVEMFYQPYGYFNKQGDIIQFPDGKIVDLSKGVIFDNGKNFLINSFVVAETVDGRVKKQIFPMHQSSSIYLVYSADTHVFILMDKNVYNSVYVKLGILGEFDPDYFEPVAMNGALKIYKVK